MAKNKAQKKKERERRVAQKKHATDQKRAKEQQANSEAQAGFPKMNVFTGNAVVPKSQPLSNKTKKPFTYLRSGG
jgi:hypothetical protein